MVRLDELTPKQLQRVHNEMKKHEQRKKRLEKNLKVLVMEYSIRITMFLPQEEHGTFERNEIALEVFNQLGLTNITGVEWYTVDVQKSFWNAYRTVRLKVLAICKECVNSDEEAMKRLGLFVRVILLHVRECIYL